MFRSPLILFFCLFLFSPFFFVFGKNNLFLGVCKLSTVLFVYICTDFPTHLAPARKASSPSFAANAIDVLGARCTFCSQINSNKMHCAKNNLFNIVQISGLHRTHVLCPSPTRPGFFLRLGPDRPGIKWNLGTYFLFFFFEQK